MIANQSGPLCADYRATTSLRVLIGRLSRFRLLGARAQFNNNYLQQDLILNIDRRAADRYIYIRYIGGGPVQQRAPRR